MDNSTQISITSELGVKNEDFFEDLYSNTNLKRITIIFFFAGTVGISIKILASSLKLGLFGTREMETTTTELSIPLNYYLCTGKVPLEHIKSTLESYRPEKFNTMPLIVFVSFLLHVLTAP